jgi:oligosaccharyltransferase complex subunit gamma
MAVMKDHCVPKANSVQLQLQTAPVLLFFPPTIGPNAKIDAQPVRYDFTSGYVE